VSSLRGNSGGNAHIWLKGRALTGKTWIALRVMIYVAQAALDQLREAETSASDLSLLSLLPLPLFIPALKLARSRPSTVESYIRSCHGLDASDELVKFLLEELESKRVMLFVDGLDDITRHRPLVVKYIEDVLLPSHSCVFLTSRGESIHWLSSAAFTSARAFATDVGSFDSHVYPVFMEGMSSKQIAAMRYLLSAKFNFPPHDLVTSHSPGQPLVDCVGGLAIASSLVLRDSTTHSSMSLVVQWCEAYLRELLFAADSRKFVLISSDVDSERGRDQRLLGSPACLTLLESVASLAISKTVSTVRTSRDIGLILVQFSDEDVASVIEANPQYGGIWSCLFKSSPVINWGPRSSVSKPIYSFSHPFILHLIVARATAARLHAGENINWLVTRRIVCSREHRGLLFMLAAMLRNESFFKLVSSLANIVPIFRQCTILLSLALTAHRPHLELQSTDTKALVSSLKSDGFPISRVSHLILHSCSPCLRSFAVNVIRASDSSVMLTLFFDSLAYLQSVHARAFPMSAGTSQRVLSCIHFLLKFVDDIAVMSADMMLDNCKKVVEILSVIVIDSDQLECVHMQGIECMFTYLNAAMRSFVVSSGNIECDGRLLLIISASLSIIASRDKVIKHCVDSHIRLVPFLCQVVADQQLHEQACLLIRSGSDDVRLFLSVAPEFECSQYDRRMSAALAASCLCSKEEMRALILAHLRDSSRFVRSAVADCLQSFPYESLSLIEVHSICNCVFVSLLLESVPEVVAALMITLAAIFPCLKVMPSAAVDAMQQHPAVFDLISNWICSQSQFHLDATSSFSNDSNSCMPPVGPEFWTLKQLLHELLIVKCRTPPPPPSIRCKLMLLFAFVKSRQLCPELTFQSECSEADETAEISSFLIASVSNVGSIAPAPHSCICAFIRMCGSRHMVPLFLRVNVSQLLHLAGIFDATSQHGSLNQCLPNEAVHFAPRQQFLMRQVSFSQQSDFIHEESHGIVIFSNNETDRGIESLVAEQHQDTSLSILPQSALIAPDALRSQFANEIVLEMISSVQSCLQTLPKDDACSMSNACQGACAYAYLILSGCSTFELSDDVLCQALSLVAVAGTLPIYLASKRHKFSVNPQDVMSSIIESASHSNFLVRVSALHALSSEYMSLALNLVAVKNCCPDFSLSQYDVAEFLSSIRRVAVAALSDESDAVVSAALELLVFIASNEADFSPVLFDFVAISLKETLTSCLSKGEGRSKRIAKIHILLEYTVSALTSLVPPPLDRIERSCVEIRRICKWFPSSHKPPLCAQSLRLQAIKASSLLLSCKRLVSQVCCDLCFLQCIFYFDGISREKFVK
jgi:hypothetical protein